MLILKLGNQLFITSLGEIWSYETCVARIYQKRIVESSTFSRTTTKHIGLVSRLMEIPRIQATNWVKRTFFTKFPMGHKATKFDTSECVSKDLSHFLCKGIAEENFPDFILRNIGRVKKERDRKLIKEFIVGQGMNPTVFDYFVAVHQALTLETA